MENTLLGRRFRIKGQCPICGKDVMATVTQTVEEGEIDIVDMIEMTCSTEPKNWNGLAMKNFMATHFSTPYIDWVPIQDDIKLAINKKVMKEYGLEYDSEFDAWFDPKQPSDSPYDVNW